MIKYLLITDNSMTKLGLISVIFKSVIKMTYENEKKHIIAS